MTAAAYVEPLAAVVLPPESWDSWLLTTVGSALDQGILQSMQLVVDRIMLPQRHELEEMRLAAQPFLHGELTNDPRRFFATSKAER